MDDKCEFAYETLGTIAVQRGNLSKVVDLFEKAIHSMERRHCQSCEINNKDP